MKVILPGATLGVLGGGQLGRMFVMAAHTLGYRVMVLDPDPASPAGRVADHHLQADFSDARALDRLAETCAAVTTEFENVPAESLRHLARRTRVSPAAEAIATVQDRIREKRFLRDCGIPVGEFAPIESEDDLRRADEALFPAILKRARLGYDGKGQAQVADRARARAAFCESGRVPCVLEKRLSLALEISVVAARGGDGSTACFPASENEHVNGILDTCVVPARVSEAMAARARAYALEVSEALDYQGVLAVEFFILESGELLANEIAPRPHNSGHYTLNACVTSQFEQQVRALAGLPLGDVRLISPSVMVNLLGDIWPAAGEPAWPAVLSLGDVKLHLYGKTQARPGRKMGHVTCLGPSVADALDLAAKVRRVLTGEAAARAAAQGAG